MFIIPVGGASDPSPTSYHLFLRSRIQAICGSTTTRLFVNSLAILVNPGKIFAFQWANQKISVLEVRNCLKNPLYDA
jgi:hypothetical protein